MDEYKPNSYKSKEQQDTVTDKKVEKVVTDPVKLRKKSSVEKLFEVFAPDDVENVKHYIVRDVIVPSIKDIILDAIKALLGVDERGRNTRRPVASKISYKDYYDRKSNNAVRNDICNRNELDYEDYVIPTRGEAENVLSKMDEIIAVYGMVSIADLYDLIGVTPKYTYNHYGWTDIRSASIVRVRDGYVVKMPKAMPLD